VDGSATCGELLDQLVYELGHVHYFDALGHLRLFKVDCTSTENLPTLDKDDLVVVGGKAITLSKKIRQYKSARVSFTRLGTAGDYLVYRNTTGRGDGHRIVTSSWKVVRTSTAVKSIPKESGPKPRRTAFALPL
jgi:hypothetical protein